MIFSEPSLEYCKLPRTSCDDICLPTSETCVEENATDIWQPANEWNVALRTLSPYRWKTVSFYQTWRTWSVSFFLCRWGKASAKGKVL